MPCSSSPVCASASSRKQSTIACTAVSDCPTPTVSTRMWVNPAASHSRMVSRVVRATPPSEPPVGEGRMNAFLCVASFGIRVLSPKMLPRLRSLLGSTVSTATCLPESARCSPSASMKVLLPTPGIPVMPMRTLLVRADAQASNTVRACFWSSGRVLSMSVMARLSITRFLLRSPRR